MHVKTSYLLALGSVLCLLLTSCVVNSDAPLSPPETAKPDPRLLGDWYAKKDGDTFHITETKGPWMHVVVTSQNSAATQSSMSSKPEEYDFFPTVLGQGTFLNVRMVDNDDPKHPATRYTFLRYSISNNHVLQMWMISQDEAAVAVRKGKLKGIVREDKDTFPNNTKPDIDVYLHDTTANIGRFIQGSDIKALFSEKMEPLYRSTPVTK